MTLRPTFVTILWPVVLAVAVSLSSCARMDQREARYKADQCPFCSLEPGTCSYCKGDKKCIYCHGTGKRTTVAPAIAEEGIPGGSYTESCPFCKGTGVCRYCEGSGKCWACAGSGKTGDWDFYDRFRKMISLTKDSIILSLNIPSPPEPEATVAPAVPAGKKAAVPALKKPGAPAVKKAK